MKFNISHYCKTLGIYQIIGGFYGVYALITSFSFLNMFTSLPFIVLLLVSGIWLLIDLNHKSYKLAFYNQLIQTIQFKLFGYGLMYASGFYLSLATDTWSIEQIYLDIRSWTFIFYIFLNSSENNFHLAINLVPIVILLFMILFKKTVFQPTQSKVIRSADQLR